MICKPERPYKSFDDFRYKSGWGISSARLRALAMPCTNCHGRGRVRDPEAYCDPVEGYKMAAHVDCPRCSGTGVVSRAVLLSEYRRLIGEYKTSLNSWRQEQRLRRSGLAKLTKGERRALGL